MFASPRLTVPTILGGLTVVLATAFLVGTLVSLIPQVTGWPGPFVDWRTYENAAARFLAGGSIYAPQQLAGPYRLTEVLLIGYAYPPASVPLLVPFQGYPVGLAAWITVNLGLLLTALWTIVSRTWPAFRLPAFAITLAGLAMFPPFLAGMIAMTTNIGLAGAIGWVAVGLNSRQAGTLGGVLGIVKVFPAALAFSAVEGKPRSVATGVLIAAALVVITLPLVGLQSWVDFARALTGAVPDCSGFNVSIACTLAPVIGFEWGSLAGILVGGLAVLGMIFCRQPYLMSLLAAVSVTAPANNLHIHYWTIGYVLVVVSVARLAVLARARRPASTTSLA